MKEAMVGQGFIDFVTQRSYPQFSEGIIHHWQRLQDERAQSIDAIQRLLAVMKPSPPFFYCAGIPMPIINKVDFDFGAKKPLELPYALYTAAVEDKIVYSSDGQLVAARPGRQVIEPPFIYESRGHYIVEEGRTVKLAADHPAAQIYGQTAAVLNAEGLVWGEDNVFLLSLVNGEVTPNIELLRSLRLDS
jgi:hypothetical protein